MTRVLAYLTILLAALSAQAQPEEEAIKITINNLFDGMRKSDTTLIRSAFAPDAILHTVGRSAADETMLRSQPLDSFLKQIATPYAEVYDERIRFETIRMDGDLALAWTPYRFYIGEKFSHCGVNSFQLVKLSGKWKIVYLIDTRRRQNCQEEN